MGALPWGPVVTSSFRPISYDFVHFHLYVVILVNCSQIWAMYCLVLFYHACMEELAPYRPFGKFVCVKAVVFFSFWQEMAIGMAVHFGIIHGTTNPFSSYTPHDVAKGSQDFLICIEMFIAAIAHHFAFHYRDFTDRNADSKIPFLKAFAEDGRSKDCASIGIPMQALSLRLGVIIGRYSRLPVFCARCGRASLFFF